MRRLIWAGFGGAACVLAASALAAGPADQAVLARQSALKAIGKTFKAIHAIGAGDVIAQRAVLTSKVSELKTQAAIPWNDFGPETKATGLKTEALPAIWTDPSDFKLDQTHLLTAVADLDAVASTGAPEVVEQKIAAVGATCGGCHRAFKAK